MNVTISLQ